MRKYLLVLLVFASFGITTTAVAQETIIRTLGLEVKYPSSLTLEKGVSSDKVMTLTNFEGKWLHGGFIPADGMEITIIRHDKEGKTLEQIIAEEGKGSRLYRDEPTESTDRAGSESFGKMTTRPSK